MVSGIRLGGMAEGFLAARKQFSDERAQDLEAKRQEQAMEIARAQLDEQTAKRGYDRYVKNQDVLIKQMAAMKTPEAGRKMLEALTPQMEATEISRRIFAPDMVPLGQLLEAELSNIETPEQKGASAGREKLAESKTTGVPLVAPNIQTVTTDEGVALIVTDPMSGNVTKQIPLGGPAFSLGKFRADLARRSENLPTGDPDTESLDPDTAQRILDNLGATSELAQLLRPNVKIDPENAKAGATEQELQQAMLLIGKSELTADDESVLRDINRRATPEQKAALQQFVKRLRAKSSPVPMSQ